MHLPNLRNLVAIEAAGSINAAARALGLAQPVLTTGMRRLERELGVPLLMRSARGTTLTEYGRALAARGRVIEAELRRARDEISQLRGAREGRLAIGVAPVPMLLVVPAALTLFRSEFPNVYVQLVEVLYPEMESALDQGRLDFAIGPLPEAGLGDAFRTEVLFDSNLVVAARKGHPRAGARSLKALRDEEWVIAGPLAGPGAVIDRMFVKHGLKPPHCVVHCESAVVATEVVAHSDLFTMIPLRLAQEGRAHSKLQVVRVQESLLRVDICLILLAHSILTPAAQALVSAIRLFGQRLGRQRRAE